MRGIRTLIIFMFITAVCNTRLPGQTVNGMPDKEQLTIALEYFSSGKYIEARNILTRLDKIQAEPQVQGVYWIMLLLYLGI